MIQNSQENSNLFATITSKVNDQEVPVLNVSTSLSSNLSGFTVSVSVLNTDLAKSAATDVQQQLNDYITNTVKSKMVELNYPIVLT